MAAELLKRRQDGVVGEDDLAVHTARPSAPGLTERADGTATTLKIVSDANWTSAAPPLEDEVRRKTMRPLTGRPHRES